MEVAKFEGGHFCFVKAQVKQNSLCVGADEGCEGREHEVQGGGGGA